MEGDTGAARRGAGEVDPGAVREAASAGFDELAGRYAADMDRQAPIIDRFRRVLHETYERYIPPGATVLELGCGTGEETLYLARTGRRVIATDVSPEMVRVTRSRIDAAGMGDRLLTAVGGGAGLLDRLPEEAGRIDAVISSLGPLNCEPDLPGLGAALSRGLEAGVPLVLSPMGRYVPWEVAALLLRGSPREAVRRLRPGPVLVPVGSTPVPVWYFSPHDFIERLGPGFVTREVRGLGVFLPPPYLHRLARLPGLLPLLDRLDERLAHRPPFSHLGDHSVIVLERR